MTRAHLVLLETSSNQAFIFATNKLNENVGASELINRVGRDYVPDAVASVLGMAGPGARDRVRKLRIAVDGAELLVASAGKAILLVRDADAARSIVSRATARAIADAPGLELRGAFTEQPIDLDAAEVDLDAAIAGLFEVVAELRADVPGPEVRFQRLPVVRPCATSGMPAEERRPEAPRAGARLIAISAVTARKWDAAQPGRGSIAESLEEVREKNQPTLRFYDNINDLETRFAGLEWLAVVHADGNGLGEIFQRFGRLAASPPYRGYADALRDFSDGLDRCTRVACRSALQEMQKRIDAERARGRGPRDDRLPVIPLVLGGDDLTMVCDGRHALDFARDFLAAFESATSAEERVAPIARAANRTAGVDSARLSACAGIAIVGRHFPFHSAYELSGGLLKAAKTVKDRFKGPCSALDFHALYDASAASLETIRARANVADCRIFARPYVVSDSPVPVEKQGEWLERHRWRQLVAAVGALRRRDADNERILSNAVLHDLRAALRAGTVQADARLKFHRGRLSTDAAKEALTVLLGTQTSLFWDETESEAGGVRHTIKVTRLVDALEGYDFVRGVP